MIYHCKHCGKAMKQNNMQGYCQACYKYFITKGKQLHEPYDGKPIRYDADGDAICPICGMAYRKLGGHLRGAHNLRAADVYRKYGINPKNAKASNISYRIKMKAIQDPKTISINLIERGKKTRIQPGEKFRIKSKLQGN